MSATKFAFAVSAVLAAWAVFALAVRAKGWRRCVRCNVWWHRSQPRVTFLNQPDECNTALPGRCRHCRGGAR